jgi:hypothetical protein
MTMAHGIWREHMSTAMKLATPDAGTRIPASQAAQRGIEPPTPPTISMQTRTSHSAAVR